MNPVKMFDKLFIAATAAIVLCGSCKNGITPGEVNEEPYDSNRLVKVALASDFDEPMEIAVTHEGKVIIVERKGTVKIFFPQSGTLKKIAALQVYTGQEDGLLGIALDPQYEKNNHVFLYYSPAGEKPVQRVSRFTLKNDSLLMNSEKVLLEIPTQREECCHSAGSLAFGPDGNLFIAVGDNTNPHNPGYYNSIDERKGREYWDAQRTASNTNDYRGKILRIHPEPDGTYTIPEGNLFPKGMDSAKPEIYVMGTRNPFRIAVDPEKGWLYWGDVGQNTINDPSRGPISYDEWNLATSAGFFGWPYFAGPNSPYTDFDYVTGKNGPFYVAGKPVNTSVNNTGLKELPPAKSALIWYSYDESKTFPFLGTGAKSPIGGPVFYTDGYKTHINDTTRHLHTHFNGKVFIAEWTRDWVNVLTVNDQGKLDSIEPFMRTAKFYHPIDLEISPDGVLYVLEYGTYWFSKNRDAGLYRIEYLRGNRSPIVKLTADRTAGSSPLSVKFSAKGSFDPDTSALSYKWYFEGDQVQSETPEASYTFSKPGVYKVKLVVTDDQGKSQEQTINIRAGNAEPEINFTVTNGNSSFYWLNTPVEYNIEVNDKEDGSLKTGTIKPEEVKITLAYSTMGTDLAMVAQSHETVSATEPDMELIRNSDCKACHAIDQKSVGPSYLAISERYKKDSATIKKLANKIITGGSGAWDETHAMSAHPQLSQEQAQQMAAFILSMKDDATRTRTLTPAGKIVPDRKKSGEQGGDYIISVSYKDKEQPNAGSNIIRKNFFLRNSRLRPGTADESKGVEETAESEVRLVAADSWIVLRNVDLTGIQSVTLTVDATQAGGVISLRAGSANGREIGVIDIPQKVAGSTAKPDQQVKIPVAKTDGMYDLFFVYTPPKGKKPDVFNALILKWIMFNR